MNLRYLLDKYFNIDTIGETQWKEAVKLYHAYAMCLGPPLNILKKSLNETAVKFLSFLNRETSREPETRLFESDGRGRIFLSGRVWLRFKNHFVAANELGNDLNWSATPPVIV